MITIWAYTIDVNGDLYHLHTGTREEACMEMILRGKPVLGRPYISKCRIAMTWRDAFLKLAKDPDWLNSHQHDEDK